MSTHNIHFFFEKYLPETPSYLELEGGREGVVGGGRVVGCGKGDHCVSYVTGVSNRYWLTVGQGLLSL